MKFKTPELEEQLSRVHPIARQMALDMDAYCHLHGFPEAVVTHVERTIEQQKDIYWRAELKAGAASPAEARVRAGKRPSLHLHLAAIDFRDYIYTREQIQALLAALRALSTGYSASHRFEILHHSVGLGFHFHVGVSDETWNNLHPPKER